MQLDFSLSDINNIAKQLLAEFPQHQCFAFYADMGSGKTTLIHALCEQLQTVDHASSPTFSIINEYLRQDGTSIFHMDWYRLKGEEDAIEAGVQDVLEREDCYRFIEWPEIAESLLPKHCINIKLEVISATQRRLIAEES